MDQPKDWFEVEVEVEQITLAAIVSGVSVTQRWVAGPRIARPTTRRDALFAERVPFLGSTPSSFPYTSA